MKRFLIIVILAAVITISLPLIMLKKPISTQKQPVLTTQLTTTEKVIPGETISVFRTSVNQAQSITMFEYVCGSVAAEMPLAYHEEAIKAQAVACYTNALRLKNDTAYEKGDISDDSRIHQGYIDEAQRREKWGADFDKYESKLKTAVKEAENQALYYNNELCVAAFYAISCGKTETAKNIWGTHVPYLVSVDSAGDKFSPNYASTVVFDKADFIENAIEICPEIKNIKTTENVIIVTKKSPSGTVLQANLNGKTFTGEEIRKAFSLRSPVFTVKATADEVTFNVSGYGHGVGLSQYGSDYLARQGMDYKEILAHYYSGAELKSTTP
ncbi:MAG: stage II sporulation protein D [Clostridia bacterium]|nr:stage II sporulation protein D [Clostridia bacterium]